MWTPAKALLWECWRVSRLNLASMMFLATLVGVGLMVLPMDGELDASLVVALAIYLALFGQLWALTIDSRTGFTLRLGFTRPIPTRVLVTVPMVYVAAASAVAYLTPIWVLRTAFGIPLPLLPAALVSTVSLTLVAFCWSSANPVRRRAFPVILWLLGTTWFLASLVARPSATGEPQTTGSAEVFSFSVSSYGWMALISAAAFWVTLAGVARQRRGDDGFSTAPPTGEGAVARPRSVFRTWIADRVRIMCPVSSPARAQLWFEMSTVGARVLTAGALTTLAAPIFLTVLDAAGALGQALYFWVWFPLMVPVLVALPSMLGLRRKQGASYLGAFAATRSLGTAHLVGLKVLVTSLAILLSWSVLVAVLWVFSVRLAAWGPETQAAFTEYWGDFFPSPLGTADTLQRMVAFSALATAVLAGTGVLHVSSVLNPRRTLLTGVGLGIYIASWVLAGIRGSVDADILATTHLWIVTVAVFLGTAFLIRRSVVERIFTLRALTAVLVIGVGLLIMSLWTNPNPDDIEDHMVAFIFGSLPLTLMVLLPWSFSRLRHR